MRILYVLTGSPVGCDQIFAKRQALALRECGIDLRMFFLPVWTNLRVLFSAYGRLLLQVRRYNPEIIHAQYGTMTAAICAFGTTRKLVITYRGSDLNPALYANPIRIRLGHVLSQLAAVRASRIICVSDQVRNRLWWRKRKAVVIPSPVDMTIFRPLSKSESRRKLGLNLRDRIVLFNAGNTPKEKGIELVEKAIEVAEREIGDIALLVLRGEIPPDRIPLYHNAADCLAFASGYEGSPNVVKEAMACNLPVVTTCVGDVQLRLEGVTPSRITGRTPVEMGKALADVLKSGGPSNGRERVKEISLEPTTKRLRSIYQSLLH